MYKLSPALFWLPAQPLATKEQEQLKDLSTREHLCLSVPDALVLLTVQQREASPPHSARKDWENTNIQDSTKGIYYFFSYKCLNFCWEEISAFLIVERAVGELRATPCVHCTRCRMHEQIRTAPMNLEKEESCSFWKAFPYRQLKMCWSFDNTSPVPWSRCIPYSSSAL